MNSDKRNAFVSRDNLLKLLSDEEVASVSSAETSALLAEGDEYIDLAHLDKGVRKSKGKSAPMGQVLPKKAVHEKTWNKILAQLALAESAGAPATP